MRFDKRDSVSVFLNICGRIILESLKPLVRVIDDDDAMRRSWAFLIEGEGWDVVTYSDALDFIASNDFQRPGCLVLDVRMPRMSGLELQDKMQELGIDLPIIFISSLSRPEAESGRSAFSELEQISSAKPALLWAGENLPGFCSYRSTCTPASASHSVASHPARPAPITFTCIVTPLWFRRYSAIFHFFSIGFVKPQPSLAQ